MRLLQLLSGLLLLASPAFGECLSIEQAPAKIGSNTCVRGLVVKVGEGRTGNFYLDFCHDYHSCPFTVFVPARSLRDVGDVRQLEGKIIEIHGRIQEYRGRAEIVLKDYGQLKGDAAKIPPIPKEFDASRKGKFSAGTYSKPKSGSTPHGQPPAMPEPQGAQQ
jgi:hypothetical protein